MSDMCGGKTSAEGALRIGMLTREFPRLSETFILDQITGLMDRGHQVTVVGGRPLPGEPRHPAIQEYQLMKHVRYGPQSPERGLRRWAALGRFAVTEGWRPSVALAAARALHRSPHLAKKELLKTLFPVSSAGDQDVFHCHFGPVANQAVEALGLLPYEGKIVTTFHGYDLSRHIAAGGEQVYRRLFRDGDLFLPVSELWRRRLIELGAPPERVVVHRMGVNTTALRPVVRNRAPESRLHVLSIGRLVEKKGFEHGIRAVASLQRQGIGVQYTIVGDGPLRKPLEKLASGCTLGDDITFMGGLTRGEVVSLLATADVLLVPSVTAQDGDQEGIPVVVMEAMATAMPVVASRHSGIPELVRNGETGLLAEERDEMGLVAHLGRLAGDAELRRALGARGRSAVERDHDRDGLMDQLVAHYRRVAAQPTVRCVSGMWSTSARWGRSR